jgi:hypothetical protein
MDKPVVAANGKPGIGIGRSHVADVDAQMITVNEHVAELAPPDRLVPSKHQISKAPGQRYIREQAGFQPWHLI